MECNSTIFCRQECNKCIAVTCCERIQLIDVEELEDTDKNIVLSSDTYKHLINNNNYGNKC